MPILHVYRKGLQGGDKARAERAIEDACSFRPEDIPARFTPAEQCAFYLGFEHRKKEWWTKKADTTEATNDNVITIKAA
jgi:hypothetical protein